MSNYLLFIRMEHCFDREVSENQLNKNTIISVLDTYAVEKIRNLKQEHLMVSENFLTYVLFMDWIKFNQDRFGKKIIARVFELTLIQVIAMSVWVTDATANRGKYQAIISSVDRIVSHKKDFLFFVSKDLQIRKRDTISSVLMFLI